MEGKAKWNKQLQLKKYVKWFIYVFLFLYPLRHIHWGLDLWDTGYNYANFQYMGLEHMDSMWLYSTYLATAVGNFLTKLPMAGSLIGMNFYTGLFVCALAIAGFWFCTEKLHIPMGVAFTGEVIALSLCWCPTALLYNYITYVFLLLCVIFLYLGLSKHRNRYLFVAGICLGINVLVRFSNLPEAAFILGVWAYAVMEGMEAAGKEKNATWQFAVKYARSRMWRYTLWCLGGYLAALAVLFGYIHVRYGMENYVSGIMRLFAMTDNATDYKASSMLMGVIGTYRENLYWIARMGVFVVAGTISYSLAMTVLDAKVFTKLQERSKGWKCFLNVVRKACYCICVAVVLVMIWWLYRGKFCSLEFSVFYEYSAIRWPGVTFLMLTMGIAIIRIFQRGTNQEEKLISWLILLVVFVTSIGSNNSVFPSMNNLFIAAPYTLFECKNFFVKVKDLRCKKIVIRVFPVKAILAGFLALFIFQCVLFSVNFTFVRPKDAAGEITATVDNNEILRGVKMQPDRAEWMQEISAYVAENELQGREVILYGELPALSYYLQMPSAFNPWSDLASYSVSRMELALTELRKEIDEQGKERPVVIVDISYGDSLTEEGNVIELPGDKNTPVIEKWVKIVDFMNQYDYKKTFENERFVIWE